jgi:hypothetical protein
MSKYCSTLQFYALGGGGEAFTFHSTPALSVLRCQNLSVSNCVQNSIFYRRKYVKIFFPEKYPTELRFFWLIIKAVIFITKCILYVALLPILKPSGRQQSG